MGRRRPPVRFVEQTDQAGTITMVQQRDVPAWRGAPDADAAERAAEHDRSGAYVQIFVEQIHRVSSLTSAQQKLFYLLVGKMGFGEPFTVSPRALAIEYGITEKKISPLLKTLRDQGILIRVHGLRHVLDPRLVWQGPSRTRLETIQYLKHEGLLE